MPSAAERIASATKTLRHDVCVTSHASGAPATTAPRLPASIVTPFSVAKRFGGNQTAETLRIAMNATETPTPTSVRPAAATSQAGARANSSEPARRDERPIGEDAARAQRVGEHADGHLQQRVDVEVGRGERAEHRRVIPKARVSSPAIAAGAVRWKNERT